MTITNSTPSEYLDRKAAAEYLGMTANWLATTGRSLGVPCFRFGNLLRYSRSELDQWVKQQRAA